MTELFAFAAILSGIAADPLPTVEVQTDNVVITKSCRVVIRPGTIIADADGNGVIQIGADDITVEFEPGSVLRGAGADAPDDGLTGVGIRVQGHKGVTIRGAVVEGFRAGIHATKADGLVVENTKVLRNVRQHLRSTPRAEDGADWLWPHKNDEHEWVKNYGAAVCVEESTGVTLRGIVVRRSQNGLVLDRVSESRVYDNDCSFLSGWGLAMWRSSKNLVSRNAIDFCVRGYSHGVYNRGQDSAGMLVFEQCSDNVFIENSVTHGGDGFFGFAGLEALGDKPAPSGGYDYASKGCNGNLFVRNDLSYAPAHGLELTFSFDNWMIDNRFVENNICGIWGGYSQRMHVVGNEFTNNGFKGAWEGGGINSEHAVGCEYRGNTFSGNSTAIAVWCRDNSDFNKKPWGKANSSVCDNTSVVANTFKDDTIALRFNDAGTVRAYGNSPEGMRIDAKGKTTITRLDSEPGAAGVPTIPAAIGEARPVGARAALRGRENIIMGEWGPWDHESPMLRLGGQSGGGVEYQVFGVGEGLKAEPIPAYAGQPAGQVKVEVGAGPIGGSSKLSIIASHAGVAPYAVRITGGGLSRTVRGTIIQADWKATFFSWAPPDGPDPRKDPEAWHALAKGSKAVSVDLKTLDLPFGHGGPKDLPALREQRDRLPGGNNFGMIARTTLELPAGKWRFSTLSDDGVRVKVGGKSVIDNWTWHGPTRDTGVFEQKAPGPVEIDVEYFEIDGFATLSLTIEPAE